MKQVFSRSQRHLSIGTIGHHGHGKTTLTAALLSYLGRRELADATAVRYLDQTRDEKALGRTIVRSQVEYCGRDYHFTHIDCPGHHTYGKNVFVGAAQLDAAILVVSAADGVCAQTREHLLLARQAGVQSIIVFLNKCDLHDDQDRQVVVEEEVRALLSSYGFPGDAVPVIRGSALAAREEARGGESAIGQLLDAVEAYVSVPERRVDLPFVMPIADVMYISGRGVVVTGRIQQGSLSTGTDVELVGLEPSRTTRVTGLETFKQRLDYGEPGDNVGIMLRGLKREDVRRGQVLAAPGKLTPRTKVVGEVAILTGQEGGRHTPFRSGYRPQFFVHTADVPCTLTLPEGAEMAMPGDNLRLHIELDKPVVIEKGQTFALRDGGTIGAGTIVEIIV